MTRLFSSLAAALMLLLAALAAPTGIALAADQQAASPNISRMEALKLAAKEKYYKAKVYLAEKAEKASVAAKTAYAKAKAEYDYAKTPEGKAKLQDKWTATKLAAKEKYYKAKVYLAEKSRQAADAAKAEYHKLKARYEASKAK